ncbi:hypothetical protein [Tenacibaculum finnmarkense]|uniref:hypothetical protein n=1 Tax=Tenacibaculum finnmarkense TaxID=2781243 RepID=UPI001EFC15CD|nr:hypothetical protein [Tenacibaculum finnmarkense]MCG8733429.1 hypothetical protein [Tenacibaculum finnmarkense]
MKKTNSFKLAMVAVGMLTIGTVSAQVTTTDLPVTAVDNKGTIKTLKVSNGITSELDAATNSTTFKLGGTLSEATTIATDGTVDAKTLNITGLEEIQSADVDDLSKTDIKPAMSFGGGDGLTLMVMDESTGEIKKLLASDAAKFLSLFNRAIRVEGSPVAPGTFTVADLPKMDPAFGTILDQAETASNIAKLFVYRNGVKLRFGTDFTVPTAGEINFTVASSLTDIIEVQFAN